MKPQIDASYPLIRQRRSFDIFACLVLVSLLLHLSAAVIFILPGRFAPPGAAAVFLELQNLTEAPAPARSQVKEEVTDSPSQTPAAEAAPESGPEETKLAQAVESSLRKAVQTPDAVHESAIGLGMFSGYFASFAEGASLKDDIRVYYFSLMRRINEVWWRGGAAQGSFANAAAVNLTLSRQGKILGCELLESSGSKEQDKALLAAIKATEPLPPLPQSYLWPTFNAPIRFVPPLRLMLPGIAGKSKLGVKHGEW